MSDRQVILRPIAKRDIRDVVIWYRRISPALAEDFVAAVDEAIALVRERPEAFPIVHRTFRRILLRRFPYGLFYDVNDARIAVVAVLHHARDPRLLQSRR